MLAWPEENCPKGRDTRDDSRNANEPRDDCRSGEKFLRSNDNRDDYHHERIHGSKSELNRHGRGAADTTTAPCLQPSRKLVSCWGHEMEHPNGERQRNEMHHFPARELNCSGGDQRCTRKQGNGTTKQLRAHRNRHSDA